MVWCSVPELLCWSSAPEDLENEDESDKMGRKRGGWDRKMVDVEVRNEGERKMRELRGAKELQSYKV